MMAMTCRQVCRLIIVILAAVKVTFAFASDEQSTGQVEQKEPEFDLSDQTLKLSNLHDPQVVESARKDPTKGVAKLKISEDKSRKIFTVLMQSFNPKYDDNSQPEEVYNAIRADAKTPWNRVIGSEHPEFVQTAAKIIRELLGFAYLYNAGAPTFRIENNEYIVTVRNIHGETQDRGGIELNLNQKRATILIDIVTYKSLYDYNSENNRKDNNTRIVTQLLTKESISALKWKSGDKQIDTTELRKLGREGVHTRHELTISKVQSEALFWYLIDRFNDANDFTDGENIDPPQLYHRIQRKELGFRTGLYLLGYESDKTLAKTGLTIIVKLPQFSTQKHILEPVIPKLTQNGQQEYIVTLGCDRTYHGTGLFFRAIDFYSGIDLNLNQKTATVFTDPVNYNAVCEYLNDEKPALIDQIL